MPPTIANPEGRNVLCGTDGEVKFEGVTKPTDAAGFFTIGVLETPTIDYGVDNHCITGGQHVIFPGRPPRR